MDEFSPYQSTSAMAGNPLLISPELLAEEGLIGQERLDGVPDFPEERVDVSMILGWKQDLLILLDSTVSPIFFFFTPVAMVELLCA